MENKNVWSTLSKIDCKEKIEKKTGLSYLSWAWAWGIVKENFNDANYTIEYFDSKPYLFDENLGYLVSTTVTILGETIRMQLPVMDGANKAQSNKKLTYQVKEYKNGSWTGNFTDKHTEPATMFDINTAIMRCLVKNLAMFGLGHYIYAGEDLPVEIPNAESIAQNEKSLKEKYDLEVLNACEKMMSSKTDEEAVKCWDLFPQFVKEQVFIKSCIEIRSKIKQSQTKTN